MEDYSNIEITPDDIKLAKKAVSSMTSRSGYTLIEYNYEDLLQVALLAMCRAKKRFDSNKSNFSYYCKSLMTQDMGIYLNRYAWSVGKSPSKKLSVKQPLIISSYENTEIEEEKGNYEEEIEKKDLAKRIEEWIDIHFTPVEKYILLGDESNREKARKTKHSDRTIASLKDALAKRIQEAFPEGN